MAEAASHDLNAPVKRAHPFPAPGEAVVDLTGGRTGQASIISFRVQGGRAYLDRSLSPEQPNVLQRFDPLDPDCRCRGMAAPPRSGWPVAGTAADGTNSSAYRSPASRFVYGTPHRSSLCSISAQDSEQFLFRPHPSRVVSPLRLARAGFRT